MFSKAISHHSHDPEQAYYYISRHVSRGFGRLVARRQGLVAFSLSSTLVWSGLAHSAGDGGI